MIKDKILRYLCIPLLGITIPFLSGIISYSSYTIPGLISAQLYFIMMSWLIWNCSTWLHHQVRSWFSVDQNIFVKISSVSLTNALFGGALAGIMTLAWFRVSLETFSWIPYILCILLSVLSVIVFTLIYEIMYLSKERQLDTRMVDQLDWERSVAEMSNLKNELEPHFIFNSLNTLSYLILNDPKTAHLFNSRLATVYKYFLINKDRDLISLQAELEFIDNYFFLIQLRYDNQLMLCTDLGELDGKALMILPFALQVTVENAIKHNEFSNQDPLKICLALKDNFLWVSNNKKPKTYPQHSTGIGLKNLKAQYHLFCKKNVAIETTDHEFIVKLPLLHQN